MTCFGVPVDSFLGLILPWRLSVVSNPLCMPPGLVYLSHVMRESLVVFGRCTSDFQVGVLLSYELGRVGILSRARSVVFSQYA